MARTHDLVLTLATGAAVLAALVLGAPRALGSVDDFDVGRGPAEGGNAGETPF